MADSTVENSCVETQDQQETYVSDPPAPVKKSSWPEVVGQDGETAKKTIEAENPDLNVIVLLDGTPTTRDLRPNRVWVWVDENGKVLRTPFIA